MTKRATRAALMGALLLGAGAAGAAPPPSEGQLPAPSDAPRPGDIELARDHYRRGNALFLEETWAPALAEFLESRRLYPAWSSTYGAAYCLKKLGRFDESLDMYATLLRDFSDKLPVDKKREAQRWLEELKMLVGRVEVEGSEPGAAIVIDQQARGDYPLLAPLPVPAGSHIIRVYKEGYEPFEVRLDIAGGTTARVAARLRKLAATGTLQVSEAQGRSLQVVVDGIGVGKTGKEPLSLPLAPGKHMVLLRGEGALGAAPASVVIRVNEVAPLRLEAEELNASMRVSPVPFDALVSIDAVLLGRGMWDGRVRPGKHTIEIAAEGFLAETRTVTIDRDKREVVEIPLRRDPKSPFWRKPPPPPHFVVELGGAAMLVPSFGGDVAGTCVGTCSKGVGLGGYSVVRGGYELSRGIGFGFSVGSLTATQKTVGRDTKLNVLGHPAARTSQPVNTGNSVDTGTTDDVLALRGLFVGAWLGYSLDAGLPLHFRLGAGGLFGSMSDARLGKFNASDGVSTYAVGTAFESHAASFVFITPEVRVGLPLGRHVELNVGLEVPFLFGVSSTAWSLAHGVHAGPDGYGWFNADALVGRVLVTAAPSLGARFDL